MTDPTAVCDAGPIIHLSELDCIDLLSDFAAALVPDQVWQEVQKHRPQAVQAAGLTRTPPPSALPADLRAIVTAYSLDAGEAECLTVMAEHPGAIFLTDDTAARLAARQLGIRVHGTIGVLLRSIRRGRRSRAQVLQVLEILPRKSTLFIASDLLKEIRDRVRGEGPPA